MKKPRWIDRPNLLGRLALGELLFWCAAAAPIVIWFKDSVPLLVFISVYAIMRTAFADWQAYRAERRENDHDTLTPKD
jgi:hypothetical protein